MVFIISAIFFGVIMPALTALMTMAGWIDGGAPDDLMKAAIFSSPRARNSSLVMASSFSGVSASGSVAAGLAFSTTGSVQKSRAKDGRPR